MPRDGCGSTKGKNTHVGTTARGCRCPKGFKPAPPGAGRLGDSEGTRTRYHMLGHTGSLKGSACGSPRTCLFTRRFTSCCCSQSTCKHTERGFVSGGQTARQTELSSSWAPSPGTDPSHGAKRIAGERVPRPCRLSEAWKHARGSRWRQNVCCSASSEKPGC